MTSMNRREFLKLGSVGALGISTGLTLLQCESQQSKPNVVLILTDDQGWGDIHSHGNEQLDTPTFDRLAEEGARFDRFFVSPVCAPTRASLLTGRYHMSTGTTGVTQGYENMRDEEYTLAELFRDNGYRTGVFGKWHNGAHFPNHPLGQGFDEFVGFLGGHWHTYYDSPLEHNGYRCQYFSMPEDNQPVGETIQTEGYISDVITDHTIQFIRDNREHPFFCYVPYNAPHAPFQVPDQYFNKYKDRSFNDVDAAVYGMVENIDDNVKRILTSLEEENLQNDTIFIFMTDNGPNGSRFNGGMRGNKGSVHEGGVRVPLFIRWPGRIQPGQTISQNTAHIDVLPTLAELCALRNPQSDRVEGVSFASLLNNADADWEDRKIYFHRIRRGNVNNYPAAVRTDRWRAVNTDGRWELYDMIADPGETEDVAGANPEVIRELSQAHAQWFQEVISEGIDAPPIPVGYAESPLVELPAHECRFTGDLEWANMGTAHDWLTHWRDTAAEIRWDLDVVRAGEYQIHLLYTCPEESLGSRFVIEIAGEQLEGQITEPVAHEPRDRPGRDTTSTRIIKDFALLEAGALNIPEGRADITIKATSKPGPVVMDLKGLRILRADA